MQAQNNNEVQNSNIDSASGAILGRIFPGIGDRIRHIRGSFTQSEFGQRVGVSQAAIARYEAGRVPKGRTLLRIAEIGQTSIDWILTGQESIAEGRKTYPSTEKRRTCFRARTPETVEVMKELDRHPLLVNRLSQLLKTGKLGRKLLEEVTTWDRKRIVAFFTCCKTIGN